AGSTVFTLSLNLATTSWIPASWAAVGMGGSLRTVPTYQSYAACMPLSSSDFRYFLSAATVAGRSARAFAIAWTIESTYRCTTGLFEFRYARVTTIVVAAVGRFRSAIFASEWNPAASSFSVSGGDDSVAETPP